MIKALSFPALFVGLILIGGSALATNQTSLERNNNVVASDVGAVHGYYGVPIVGDPKFWDFHEVPNMYLSAAVFGTGVRAEVRAYYSSDVDAYYGVPNIGDAKFWDIHEVPDTWTGSIE